MILQWYRRNKGEELRIGKMVFLFLIVLVLGCAQPESDSGSTASSSADDSAIKEAPAISEAVVPEAENVEKVVEVSATKPQAGGLLETSDITPTPEPRRAAKPVTSIYSAAVPPVILSETHRQQCLVSVGDEFPALELANPEGETVKLASQYGKVATVVLLWTPDRWMSRAARADIARDVVGLEGIRVISVALGTAAETEAANDAEQLMQLQDREGVALSQVGSGMLPRIYVLDRAGVIAWFDVEYSEATRRELDRTLAILKSLP